MDGGEEEKRRREGEIWARNATQGQIKKGMEEARRRHYKEGKEDCMKTRCMWMEEWRIRGEEKQRREEEEKRREEGKRRVDSGGRNAGPGQIRKIKEEARRGHCKERKGKGQGNAIDVDEGMREKRRREEEIRAERGGFYGRDRKLSWHVPLSTTSRKKLGMFVS